VFGDGVGYVVAVGEQEREPMHAHSARDAVASKGDDRQPVGIRSRCNTGRPRRVQNAAHLKAEGLWPPWKPSVFNSSLTTRCWHCHGCGMSPVIPNEFDELNEVDSARQRL